MKWLKDNPFLAGLVLVTVVGAGALAFLLSEALGRYQETFDSYTQTVQKLHALQGLSPFPSTENLAKSRAITSDYAAAVNTLRGHLAAMKLPLDTAITPQKFQDNLRTAVNETAQKASQAGVALPKDFYLGFGPYATSLPSEQAAPYLFRQLLFIKQLVQQLIDLKIKSVDELVRPPIPQETANSAPAQQPKKRPAAESTPDLFDRLPIDLGFTAEQSKFRVAFNTLLDHGQFLIIRSLQIQNSSPQPPPVIKASSNEQPQPGPGTVNPNFPVAGVPPFGPPNSKPSDTSSNELNVILGRELVKATMHLEILDFSAPEPEKTEAKPAAK